jgi:hypothetical protein
MFVMTEVIEYTQNLRAIYVLPMCNRTLKLQVLYPALGVEIMIEGTRSSTADSATSSGPTKIPHYIRIAARASLSLEYYLPSCNVLGG